MKRSRKILFVFLAWLATILLAAGESQQAASETTRAQPALQAAPFYSIKDGKTSTMRIRQATSPQVAADAEWSANSNSNNNNNNNNNNDDDSSSSSSALMAAPIGEPLNSSTPATRVAALDRSSPPEEASSTASSNDGSPEQTGVTSGLAASKPTGDQSQSGSSRHQPSPSSISMSLDGMILNSRPRATSHRHHDQPTRDSSGSRPTARHGELAPNQAKNPRRVPLAQAAFSSPATKGLRTKPSASNSYGVQPQPSDFSVANLGLSPSVFKMSNLEFLPKDDQARHGQQAHNFLIPNSIDMGQTVAMFNTPNSGLTDVWATNQQLTGALGSEQMGPKSQRSQFPVFKLSEDHAQTEDMNQDYVDSLEPTLSNQRNPMMDIFGGSKAGATSAKLPTNHDMRIVSSTDGNGRQIVVITSMQKPEPVAANPKKLPQAEFKTQKGSTSKARSQATNEHQFALVDSRKFKATLGGDNQSQLAPMSNWSVSLASGQQPQSSTSNSVSSTTLQADLNDARSQQQQQQQSLESQQSSTSGSSLVVEGVDSSTVGAIDSSSASLMSPKSTSEQTEMREASTASSGSTSTASSVDDSTTVASVSVANEARKQQTSAKSLNQAAKSKPKQGQKSSAKSRTNQSAKQANTLAGTKTRNPSAKKSKPQQSSSAVQLSLAVATTENPATGVSVNQTKDTKVKSSAKKGGNKSTLDVDTADQSQANATSKSVKQTNGQQLFSVARQSFEATGKQSTRTESQPAPMLESLGSQATIGSGPQEMQPQPARSLSRGSAQQKSSVSISNLAAVSVSASASAPGSTSTSTPTPTTSTTSTTSSTTSSPELASTFASFDARPTTKLPLPLPLEQTRASADAKVSREKTFDQKMDELERLGAQPKGPAKGQAGEEDESANEIDTRESIPGEPGVDYPVYSSAPRSSFSCMEQSCSAGYYADVETQCQVFHVCQYDGRFDTFLCPNGTIFSQQHFVCVWWWQVECQQSTKHYKLNDAIYCGPSTQEHQKFKFLASMSFEAALGDNRPTDAGNGEAAGQSPSDTIGTELSMDTNRGGSASSDDARELAASISSTPSVSTSSSPQPSSTATLMMSPDLDGQSLISSETPLTDQIDAIMNWPLSASIPFSQFANIAQSKESNQQRT